MPPDCCDIKSEEREEKKKRMKKKKSLMGMLLAAALLIAVAVPSPDAAAAGADISGDVFGQDGSIYTLAPSGDVGEVTGVTVTVQCVKYAANMGDNSCCVAIYDGSRAICATGSGTILSYVSGILGVTPTEGSGDTFTLSYDTTDLTNVAVVACSGDFNVVDVQYKTAGGGTAAGTGTTAPATADFPEKQVYGMIALAAVAAAAVACWKKSALR